MLPGDPHPRYCSLGIALFKLDSINNVLLVNVVITTIICHFVLKLHNLKMINENRLNLEITCIAS